MDSDLAAITTEVTDYVTRELLKAGVNPDQAYVNTFIDSQRQQFLLRVFSRTPKRRLPDREVARATLDIHWVDEHGKNSGRLVREAVEALLRGIRALEPDLIDCVSIPPFQNAPEPTPEPISEETLEIVRQVYQEALERRARHSR